MTGFSTFDGDKLAKFFIDNTDDLPLLTGAMRQFHNLDKENQNRFLSFIAGVIQKVREELK